MPRKSRRTQVSRDKADPQIRRSEPCLLDYLPDEILLKVRITAICQASNWVQHRCICTAYCRSTALHRIWQHACRLHATLTQGSHLPTFCGQQHISFGMGCNMASASRPSTKRILVPMLPTFGVARHGLFMQTPRLKHVPCGIADLCAADQDANAEA